MQPVSGPFAPWADRPPPPPFRAEPLRGGGERRAAAARRGGGAVPGGRRGAAGSLSLVLVLGLCPVRGQEAAASAADVAALLDCLRLLGDASLAARCVGQAMPGAHTVGLGAWDLGAWAPDKQPQRPRWQRERCLSSCRLPPSHPRPRRQAAARGVPRPCGPLRALWLGRAGRAAAGPDALCSACQWPWRKKPASGERCGPAAQPGGRG